MAAKKLALKALDLMTTSDVAKELGVTIRSVQLWVERGALEAWKTPGGHRRITRASFDRMATAKKHPNAADPSSTALRVVALENDEARQALYQRTIESWGLPIEITFISNACEGLIYIVERKPDLLLTDLTLPEIDGFAMLKALRENEALSSMAIAVVTQLPESAITKKGGLPKRVRLYRNDPIPFWEMKEFMCGLIDRKAEQSDPQK